MNKYDVGDLVQSTAAFANNNGVATDPTTVVFKHKDPSGNIASFTYGGTASNTALTKLTTGTYALSWTLDEEGLWCYRWEGSGTIQAAEEGMLSVKDSAFS
jgi:hypothetical protein